MALAGGSPGAARPLDGTTECLLLHSRAQHPPTSPELQRLSFSLLSPPHLPLSFFFSLGHAGSTNGALLPAPVLPCVWRENTQSLAATSAFHCSLTQNRRLPCAGAGGNRRWQVGSGARRRIRGGGHRRRGRVAPTTSSRHKEEGR
ncbi:hypothetical protein D1007_59443 [Hordeum vulgare]|nr:hypothetical protein D1007_59443 [Hordeum vulgare]